MAQIREPICIAIQRMKTYHHLFEEICSFGNLLEAARRAERGKRLQDRVGRFRMNIEAEILGLQQELIGWRGHARQADTEALIGRVRDDLRNLLQSN